MTMFTEFISFILRISLIVALWAFVWKLLEPRTQLMRILRAAVLLLGLLGVLAVLKMTGRWLYLAWRPTYPCHSRARACWKNRDWFVATLLAMTRNAISGHCERFEESRGNLKTFLWNFFNRPASGNPSFSQNHRTQIDERKFPLLSSHSLPYKKGWGKNLRKTRRHLTSRKPKKPQPLFI